MTKKEVRGARARVGRLAALGVLGAMAAGSAQAGPTFQVGDEGSLTLNYELQIWSQFKDFRSNEHDGESYDTFLRRNRITVTGQYNDYVGFYAQIEAGNDSKYGNDDRNTFFRDAYVTFDWSDSVRFIAGRFKNTFTRENLEACFEPLTLDRGLISYSPFGGTRDTGIAMWGNLADAKFQYRVMLADGREGDEVPKDSPRMTARVHYSLFDPEFSYGYRGTYLGTQKVLTIGAAVDRQADVAYANYLGREDAKSYTAWTTDVFFEYPTDAGTVTLSGAYMDYDVDGALEGDPMLIDPDLTPAADQKGYYVKGGYLFPDKIGIGRLQLFARYEHADYDRNDPYYDYDIASVGANYYISGQQLKFTAEYSDVKYDEQHPTLNSLRDYKQATLGFQMLF
ncbi:MAG: selenite/tellurite reduction operon porin ExtI [Ectothiorhodospiraceae bacterium]|jgi:hypothetical protein|nr:selenite/tellurite reduction operon porin ExtI [Ectothiorhodospiraceae bacterium]